MLEDLRRSDLAFKGKKVLIVDDDMRNIFALSTVLEEYNMAILSADILLDVHMPDIDGFETTRLIRQRKRSGGTPIIFLTAFTEEVKTVKGYVTGAVDYLATPVVSENLRAKVRVFDEMYHLRARMALQAEREALRTAGEENGRRSAILAEASRAPANSLDLDFVLSEVAGMCLPASADAAVVALSDGAGGIGRVKWACGGSKDLANESFVLEPWLSDD